MKLNEVKYFYFIYVLEIFYNKKLLIVICVKFVDMLIYILYNEIVC